MRRIAIVLSIASGAAVVGGVLGTNKPTAPDHDAMVAFCAFGTGDDLGKVEEHLDARAGGNPYVRRAALHVHWGKSSADKAYQARHDAVMVGVWQCPLADAYDADEMTFRSEYAMLCQFDALERPPPKTCDTPMSFQPSYGTDRLPPDQFLAQVRHRSTSLATRTLIDRTASVPNDEKAKVWNDAKPVIPTCFTGPSFAFECPMASMLGSTDSVPVAPVRRPAYGGVRYRGSGGFGPSYGYPVE